MIVTTNLAFGEWPSVFGDPSYADPILDRHVHNAHRIDLTGDSLRRRRSITASRPVD